MLSKSNEELKFRKRGVRSNMLEKEISRKNVLETFVKTLKEKYGDKIESIILFGSVARGENREGEEKIERIRHRCSDNTNYDSFKIQRLVSDIVVGILFRTGIYMSAKVLSHEEIYLKKVLKL